jgi:hypothetical protein
MGCRLRRPRPRIGQRVRHVHYRCTVANKAW